MHGTLCVHWIHGVQDVIIGYRCFPCIFLVKNWLLFSNYSIYLICLFYISIYYCYLFSSTYGFRSAKYMRKPFWKSYTLSKEAINLHLFFKYDFPTVAFGALGYFIISNIHYLTLFSPLLWNFDGCRLYYIDLHTTDHL